MTPQRLRLLIQSAFCLFCLWAGVRFYQFILWTGGKAEAFTPRPPSVEGFLPISAFMALKQFLLTGLWDRVHPAGLTLLLVAMGTALALRKGFCATICPVGFIHNLLERAGRTLGTVHAPGPKLGKALSVPKYLVLGFFIWTTWVQMDARAINQFLSSTYNLTADARMLDFFLAPSTISITVLVVLGLLAMVVPSFWCRALCPYGALLGLASLFSPLAVHRKQDQCIDCGKCNRACPTGINVMSKQRVGTPECIGCMQCVGACPVQGCLEPRMAGRWRISPLLVLTGAAVLLLIAWAWAAATGHWDNGIPAIMQKRIYMMMG
ncbi:4Fe-4S binding protein [Desulfovibrio ferrophilus]|uniref:4Fe-4S ferredoxin iron-sulfur binding domain protein n=1 Tax=Desulfovibrio ferrophilus TaxID=241368 RepID=A0A2Z6AUI0_9BACT|nr:4Fe-4S binding protein [Desulfovibrio ferrophilus]BBD06846.1 4Fe-4S ferredoxin iron-sulfur binding domain protein [Desulfovibrio ferrophilus]